MLCSLKEVVVQTAIQLPGSASVYTDKAVPLPQEPWRLHTLSWVWGIWFCSVKNKPALYLSVQVFQYINISISRNGYIHVNINIPSRYMDICPQYFWTHPFLQGKKWFNRLLADSTWGEAINRIAFYLAKTDEFKNILGIFDLLLIEITKFHVYEYEISRWIYPFTFWVDPQTKSLGSSTKSNEIYRLMFIIFR